MRKIKLILLSAVLPLIAGCYQWRGEFSTRLTGHSLKPGAEVLAIAITEHYSRYPLLNMSGWSRGVPKINKKKGVIYYYHLKDKKLEKKASIKFPKAWGDGSKHEITLHIWDDGGLYFKLSDCPFMNKVCDNTQYYQLLANGKIKQVKALPKVTDRYMDSLRGLTTYKTFDNQVLAINIGRAGDWTPILIYQDHKLIPADSRGLEP